MTVSVLFGFLLAVLLSKDAFCFDSVDSFKCENGKEGCTKNYYHKGSIPEEEIKEYFGTEKPKHPPESFSMLFEDENPVIEYAPTGPTTMISTIQTNVSDEPKGRALDFAVEPGQDNKISKVNSKGTIKDLSDVSMDDEEEEFVSEKIVTTTISTTTSSKVLNTTESNMKKLGICSLGGLTYENGEKLEHSCDSVCTCLNGNMNCTDRCIYPKIKKGSKLKDPLCTEKPTEDPCCSTWFCASDIETEPLEMCSYKGKTYQRSEKFEDGCESICTCESGGKVNCKPRCPKIEHKTSDSCVEVPDQSDRCCKKLLCDVTLDDNESEKDDKMHPKIVSAVFVNKTTIKIKFNSIVEENKLPEVQLSSDKMSWKTHKLRPEGILTDFDEGSKFVKIHGSSDIFEINTPENHDSVSSISCEYKGKIYKLDEEFNDNCTSFCVCKNTGIQCLKLECPTYFGVDVLDPTCVEWQTVPEDFVPSPPNCCPKEVKCKNNGSCTHEGVTYSNWQELPTNVTGCEMRCYCEMGKIECQNICPVVTALPPANIGCAAHEATLSHLPDDDCCKYWVCNASSSSDNDFNGFGSDNEYTTRGTFSETTFSPFDKGQNISRWPEKPPSKISGPLLVYANKNSENDPVFGMHVPSIEKDENYYYNKNSENKNSDRISIDPYKNNDKGTSFLGPFNPHYKTDLINNKPPKGSSNKHKHNKDGSLKDINIELNDLKLKRPTYENNSKFVKGPKNPPFVNNNSDQSQTEKYPNSSNQAEEILQIINKHPELANYPPGSVFEVHDIPVDDVPQKTGHQSLTNLNILIPSNNNNRPVIPYVQNHQTPEGVHVHEIPGQGLDLDQLLQQIHRPHSPSNNVFNPQSSNGILLTNGQNKPTSSYPKKNVSGQIFSGFPGIPPNAVHRNQDEIVVHSVQAVDPHTIRLEFSVPPIIVGLHGQVEVRYTSKLNDDLEKWNLQVFTPPDDYISTPQMEFDLLGLEADTEYKIKVTVVLRGLHNTPTSEIHTVRTPKESISALPSMIPIDPQLEITEINSTKVTVSWRKFTDQELQLIDGIQLRYKEIDGKIYQATPLIHRMVTSYSLNHLKPNTQYELGIFFIPFEGQTSELQFDQMMHFTTANEVDTYGFNVTLEITNIKATSVEITWFGVPYPQDKYVNIYRAIYQTPSGKGDFSTFKIAKRDSTPKTIIKDLNPRTKYRLWLEVYLTNGKIKTSNVKDFTTKSSPYPPKPSQIVSGEPFDAETSKQNKNGDYYGALVVVAIIAALAIVSTVVLLMILFKRHSKKTAAITTPSQRVSQSAYDNPTYKVEIQQETMDL